MTHGPLLTEEGKEIVNCTDKNWQAQQFEDALGVAELALSKSGSATSSCVVVPPLHRIQIAQILKGEYRVIPLTSLDEATEPG